MVKVVIIGGSGLLGTELALELLDRKFLDIESVHSKIDEICIFDQKPNDRLVCEKGNLISFVEGDIRETELLETQLSDRDVCIFNLASVVSQEGEKDFEKAISVNLEGHMNLLTICKKLNAPLRLVYTSSLAVFGDTNSVLDSSKRMPLSTYGVTKTIGELLINEYSRKRFIDGRCARLPTIVIRPGGANAAASSFYSDLFKKTLNGQHMIVPVPPDFISPILGLKDAVDGLISLMEVPEISMETDRAYNFPNISVSIEEIVASVNQFGRQHGIPLGSISFEIDSNIYEIVRRWPKFMNFERAQLIGIPPPSGLNSIVKEYLNFVSIC